MTVAAADRIATSGSATTYYHLATAVDAGGESSPSGQASAATQAASARGGPCHFTFVGQNDRDSGFTGNISIGSTGAAALTIPALNLDLAGQPATCGRVECQRRAERGRRAFTSESCIGSIAAGATLIGMGFNANYSGKNTLPTLFYLNAALCH